VAKYRRVTEVTAISFDDLVEHGKAYPGVAVMSGMPLYFRYLGHPVQYVDAGLVETDDTFHLPSNDLERKVVFRRGQLLVHDTSRRGFTIYPDADKWERIDQAGSREYDRADPFDVPDGQHCGSCGGTQAVIVSVQDGLLAERCVGCGEQELLADSRPTVTEMSDIKQILAADMTRPDGPLQEPKRPLGLTAQAVYALVQEARRGRDRHAAEPAETPSVVGLCKVCRTESGLDDRGRCFRCAEGVVRL
jgi:hypothetical protein